MYNKWFSNEVATTLSQGVNPTEVKITSQLSDLKPLCASWIVDLYGHLKKEIGKIIKVSIPQGLQRLLIMLNLFMRKLKILFEVPKLCFLIKKRKE